MNIVKNIRENKLFCAVIRSLTICVIALVLSHSLFSQLFLTQQPLSKIEIIDTATKNKNSFGTDVRIGTIEIDGNIIPFEDLECDPEWSSFDDIIGAVNPCYPVKMTYEAENAEELSIVFQKHEGSGVVQINVNGQQIKTMDLYSPDWKIVTVKINLGRVAVLKHLDAFFVLYIILFAASMCVNTVMEALKTDTATKCFSIVLILLYGSLWVGWYSFGIQENVMRWHAFFILLFAFEWLLVVKVYMERKIHAEDWISFLYHLFVYIISAVVLCVAVEKINSNFENLTSKYLVGNVIVYLAIILIFDILLRRTALAVLASALLALVYALANYFVTVFRGSPIVPGDFLVLNTAKSVAANYKYSFTWDIFYVVIFMIAWITAVCYLYRMKKSLNKKMIVFNIASAAVIVQCICVLDFYEPSLDLWNLNANVSTYGVAMSMVSNVRQMKVSPAESYSVQTVKELYEQFEKNSSMQDQNDLRPNVIVIMNESFSDLSVISETINNEEIMPYFNSINKNAIKGKVYVSTIGGGTANTEWEMLTGNTRAFVKGAVPYQQYILKDSDSIVWTFKQKGYYTAAIHPYYASGYNRIKVYPRLGFDDFFDIESFENPSLSRDRYITDEESYKKVIEVFEDCKKNEKQAFIFNVTMQNHSDYLSGYWGDQVIKVPGYEGEFPDVEEYLTLIKQSDDAFSVLIDYFSSIDEPTVILIFGDHQPKVDDVFYETMKGKALDDWTLEEAQQRYEVPFIVWANYDIKEETDVVISANYLSSILFDAAGIRMTPYQQFLKKLSETIPVINVNGYLGINGQWYDYRSESPYTDYLEDYWNIQYNNMFDRNKVDEWFNIENSKMVDTYEE